MGADRYPPRWLRALGWLGLALLAACATVPRQASVPAAHDLSWVQRQSLLQAVQGFALEGRLAAAVEGEGFNASLSWTQHGDRSELDLRAPLGFGAARVVRDATGLTLEGSRGERFSGPAAGGQLAQRLGFEPPLDSLRWWVLGLADPAAGPAQPTLSEDGRQLQSLQQAGWRLDYSEYARFGQTPELSLLPRRLTLTREGVRLRLVVDRWRLPLP